MALTPTLKSIEDFFEKLKREASRAYYEDEIIDKADHFYNFCVTAHSMKDHFFEYKKIIKEPDKNPYRERWDKDKFLVAASEIANTLKHFTLRKRSGERKEVKTKKVEQKSIFSFNMKKFGLLRELEYLPDLIVTLEDGEEFQLSQFARYVIDYWREFLSSQSIGVPPEPFCPTIPDSAPLPQWEKEGRLGKHRRSGERFR